ncbi:MAG: hypothetical protein R3C18_27475 [Planctomycetaceae bacterium]
MIRQPMSAGPGPGRIVALLLASILVGHTFAAENSPPNVLFILADDMNSGCCCNEEIAGENHCFSSSSERN